MLIHKNVFFTRKSGELPIANSALIMANSNAMTMDIVTLLWSSVQFKICAGKML